MSVFRLFSFNNLGGCRGVLCTRNALSRCDEQRVSMSYKIHEKLGIPAPPKRPLTPYLRFVQNVRPKIVQSEPNLDPHQVIKKVAQEWRDCDPELKKRLQKEYLSEMEVHIVENNKYKESITPEQQEQLKSAKDKEKRAKEVAVLNSKKESLGRPKKPATAFIKFMLEKKTHRDESIKYTEWLSDVSKQWEQTPEHEKEKYKLEVKAELEKYRKDVLTWEEKMLRQGHIDVVRNRDLLDKSKKKLVVH